MRSVAIYVHIPFCIRRCGYCDFNTYSGMDSLIPEYMDCLIDEIRSNPHRGLPASSIFLGGGTPTILLPEHLIALLKAITDSFPPLSDAEISAEANPARSDMQRFKAMHKAGFNRLSIGVQSFEDPLLKRIGRSHSSIEALQAVETARSAGFKNLSIDLMFGLPNQTPTDWDRSLTTAINLQPEHISAYALTVENGTPFYLEQELQRLSLPDEDMELAMFERAIERLTGAGYDHYEVSNYAMPGCRARHNLAYWHNEEYLGFGPGAVSYFEGRRWKRENNPARYIEKYRSGANMTVEDEQLDSDKTLSETIMLGLRLREGVEYSGVQKRFGIDVYLKYRGIIEKLVENGLLVPDELRLRLTHRGLLFLNDVAAEFM